MRVGASLPLGVLAAALAVGGSTEPAPGSGPTREELLGAWSGTMVHEGEVETFAMELEPADGGRVVLRLTLAPMHLSRVPVGTFELELAENQATIGPFVFRWDGKAGTLSGTMPGGMVPVYEIPVTLRRVEAIEPLERAEPTAPRVEPLWSFDAGAALWPGATVAHGVVYAGDDAGVLHAVDAEDGTQLWSFATGGPIRTRPTVWDGSVFFQADDGILYRLDAASGEAAWQIRVLAAPVERRPPGDPQSRYDSFGSDVTVAEGRLFVGAHDGRVLALRPRDGKVLWQHPVEGGVLAAPAVAGGRVYAGAFGGHVYALDAVTGEELWRIDTKGAVVSTPAAADDLLIVGNRSYDLLALEAKTGKIAWKSYLWFSWIESSATVRGGVAYIGSSDAAAAFAFAVDTGERLWESDVHGWSWGQPAVSDERVYIQTAGMRGYQSDNHRGGVMALDRASGEAVWHYGVEPPDEGTWGFPGSAAVASGRVFVTGLDGRILAFAP